MRIGKSSSQIETGSAAMSSTKQQVLRSLQRSKEYRHSFIDEAIRSRITAQIKAMRDQWGWDYKKFAEELGKSISWTYRLEDPNASMPTVPTLLHIAKTFDIALDVRFCGFSELVEDIIALGPESFSAPSFDYELRAGSFSKPTRKRRIRARQGARSRHSGQYASRDLERKLIGTGAMPRMAA
jgi:transcriptional regulator with XRE-family HTH domain